MWVQVSLLLLLGGLKVNETGLSLGGFLSICLLPSRLYLYNDEMRVEIRYSNAFTHSGRQSLNCAHIHTPEHTQRELHSILICSVSLAACIDTQALIG